MGASEKVVYNVMSRCGDTYYETTAVIRQNEQRIGFWISNGHEFPFNKGNFVPVL